MEYQIFYEQERPGSKIASQKFRRTETVKFPVIEPGETKTIETVPVKIEDCKLASGWYYISNAPKDSEGKLKGILLVLTKKSIDGKTLTKEKDNGSVPSEKRRSDYQKVYKMP